MSLLGIPMNSITHTDFNFNTMKTHLDIKAVLFAIITLLFCEVGKCDSAIPINEWEQIDSKGIALALIWKGKSIIVYIKNTSTTTQRIIGMGNNTFVKIFYINENNAPTFIGDHPFYNDERDYSSKELGRIDIKPNAIEENQITVNTSDVSLIKTHAMICTFSIYNPTTKQKSTIKSTPKLLLETPAN